MKHYSLSGAAISMILAACSDSGTGRPTPTSADAPVSPLGAESVALINGQGLPTSLLERLSLVAAQREASALSSDERARLVEQLVTTKLLADAAVSDGLHLQREVAAELELQRLETLARAETDAFRAEHPPTESELRAAYEANLPRYLATQYKARHILVDEESEAQAIIAELDGGADFADMARQHSTGPTGPRGGDLGWFRADSMVAPFADAVRSAEVGTYRPAPVQTRFGWHVILVEEVREQQAPGVEAVRDELISIVEREKLDSYVGELGAQAQISKDED